MAADGNYNIPALPIGHYSIDVSSSGFESNERTGLTTVVDQHAQVDFTLVAGSTGEVVTVAANSNQIETESHSIGTVVDQQKLDQLPLNSCNFNTLAHIVPAVFPPVFNFNLRYRRGFNVAGASEASNNFTLDGLTTTTSS